MSLDLSADGIARRLREAAGKTSLDPRHRLDAKIGLTAEAIARRIRTASQLRRLCLRLGRAATPRE